MPEKYLYGVLTIHFENGVRFMREVSGPGRKPGKTWLVAALACVTASTAAIYAAVERDHGSTADAAGQTPSPAAAQPTESAPVPTLDPSGKWVLAWWDEFNGTGAVDKRQWSPVTGNGTDGWSHHALQYYTAESNRMDGAGHLVISAAKAGNSGLKCFNGPCQYVSGRLQTGTHFSQKYGRFEARMKLPAGKGIWPAFWMQSVKKPYAEIDIAESIGRRPHVVQGKAHDTRPNIGGGSVDFGTPVSAAYHVYGVDWTPKAVTWWIDGKTYATMKRYKNWPFDHPEQIILTLQVGGDWPGAPSASTKWPQTMSVDWIRVYRMR
jgi:beta-glucanase (GH16 family)